MPSLLIRLRQTTAQPTPSQFLHWQPGCWVQYYDDTPAKDPGKAFSTGEFDPGEAHRKQAQKCAVCFSLQAFHGSRTRDGLLSFRNLGVDVDLIPAADRTRIGAPEIDERKEAYLTRTLRPFPLRPHWLIETRHGFHLVFRVLPVRDPADVAAAEDLNRRLVRVLSGDPNAALLTQVLRVPGTRQFKDPSRPFLCRLLLDRSASIPPYPLSRVQSTLDAWEVFYGTADEQLPQQEGLNANPSGGGGVPAVGSRRDRLQSGLNGKSRAPDWWQEVLAGVPEGQRNSSAARVAGGILGRLPEAFWELAGWGGLKEWNARNALPLAERELRAVYASIARRERGRRHRTPTRLPTSRKPLHPHVGPDHVSAGRARGEDAPPTSFHTSHADQ
jgi:hypothetical protein